MKKVLLALALTLLVTGSASAQYRNGFNGHANGFYGNYGHVTVFNAFPFYQPQVVLVPSVQYVTPAPSVLVTPSYSYSAAYSPPVTYSVTLATAQTYGYATPFNVVFNAGNFYHSGTGAVITGNFANYLHSVHASRR